MLIHAPRSNCMRILVCTHTCVYRSLHTSHTLTQEYACACRSMFTYSKSINRNHNQMRIQTRACTYLGHVDVSAQTPSSSETPKLAGWGNVVLQLLHPAAEERVAWKMYRFHGIWSLTYDCKEHCLTMICVPELLGKWVIPWSVVGFGGHSSEMICTYIYFGGSFL